MSTDPEYETINIERLEEIVKNKELNPSFKIPIVEYAHGPRDCDIGD